MNLNQAVIFCGGRGERLRPLTDHMPKPMIPVNGKPFLDYLLQTLKDAGIRKVLLLTGYKAEKITEYYYRYDTGDFRIDESRGTAEDLTGRRLLNAYPMLDEHFLLCYGDNYWPIEIEAMKSLYESHTSPIMTTVFSNKFGTAEYGQENNIEVIDNQVIQYDKRRLHHWSNGVDIGYFIVEKNSLSPYLEETGNISFEETIVANKARLGQMTAYVTDRQYHWITTLEDLKNFEKLVSFTNYKPIEWRKLWN